MIDLKGIDHTNLTLIKYLNVSVLDFSSSLDYFIPDKICLQKINSKHCKDFINNHSNICSIN